MTGVCGRTGADDEDEEGDGVEHVAHRDSSGRYARMFERAVFLGNEKVNVCAEVFGSAPRWCSIDTEGTAEGLVRKGRNTRRVNAKEAAVAARVCSTGKEPIFARTKVEFATRLVAS